MRARIVGADGGEADALGLQRGGVLHEPVDHGLDIGTVVADEGDHRALGAGNILQRVRLAIGGGQPEIGSRRPQRELRIGCGHNDASCQRALLVISLGKPIRKRQREASVRLTSTVRPPRQS